MVDEILHATPRPSRRETTTIDAGVPVRRGEPRLMGVSYTHNPYATEEMSRAMDMKPLIFVGWVLV